MGAAVGHAGVDCCVPNGENAEPGTTSQTLPSGSCFVDSEPACAFDCDEDGAPDKESPQAESTAPSAVPYLRRAPTESLHADAELIRSVSLATTLKRFGRLWRLRPEKMSKAQLEKLWATSVGTDSFDTFLSHTWWTPGYQKYISLLLHFYWHYALSAMIVTWLVILMLYGWDILPMPLPYPANFVQFRGEIMSGPWSLLLSFVAALVTLALAPALPSCRTYRCFYDVACIHQTDAVLRTRGIYGIGGYLSVAKELRILWSGPRPVGAASHPSGRRPLHCKAHTHTHTGPLLSRLWCIFELAAYRHANARGKLTFQPLFIERNFLALWPCWFFVPITYTMVNAVSNGLTFIPGFISLAAVIPGAHAIRRGFQEQESSLQQMANFDLSKVSCSDDADRQFILAALVEWYGSTAAFTDYVRGPLRAELVKAAEAATAPLSYCLLIYSPALAMSFDVLGALWNAGAPSEVIWSYFVGETISSAIMSVAVTQQVLIGLCQRFAKPRFESRAMDYLQTAGVVLVYSMVSVLALAKVPLYRNYGMPGALIGLALSVLFFAAMVTRGFKRLRASVKKQANADGKGTSGRRSETAS
ncbi:amt-3 [Symbiodinium sp. CCMP2456]|nr:amt-3 [Symbiodinium sp. CCMP2456]